MSEFGLRTVDQRPPPDPGRRRRSTWRNAASVAVALALVGVLFAAGVAGLGRVASQVVGPPVEVAANYEGPGGPEVLFQVRPGDTAKDMGERMQQADIVKSADGFVAVAALDERAGRIQPGLYRLRKQISGEAAFGLLLDPASRAEARVTVPEGLRLEQTLQTLSKGTGIPVAEYRKAVSAGAIGLPAVARGRAEGFLFPATYSVPPGSSATGVLRQMTARFEQAAAQVGLTTSDLRPAYDLVTIASLIEAEADGPADFGKVSRVIHNRLNQRIALQFDSTINYANGESKDVIFDKDVARAASSPYSTYENRGLPPGPIGSPGEKALAAARNPPPGDWLYFITTNLETGETSFTPSYDEFVNLKNACKAAATC